ncbi:MAG TPA: helix-turn-helix transcriptional regulator [Gemmatimonadaceae bacterium]
MPRGSRASQPEDVYRIEITGTVDLRTGEIRFAGQLKGLWGLGDADACQVDGCVRPGTAADDVDAEPRNRRKRLTTREMEVVRLLARGLSNAEVARRLEISTHTARRHTERVLFKLGVHSRAQVAARMFGDRGGIGLADRAEKVVDRPVESDVEVPSALPAIREASDAEHRL